MSKKRLVFDVTDTNSIADSDKVGAFLLDGSGNQLSSTDNAGKQSLDVNLTGSTGSITVTATDLDIRDLTAATDSVRIGDGTDFLAVNADGSINVQAEFNSPIKFRQDGLVVEVIEDTVTPANNQPLPVKLTGATGDINITAGDINVQLDHTGANFDSVRIGDGTELVAITQTNDMQVVDRVNAAILSSAQTVGTSAVQIAATSLANRKKLIVSNESNQAIYLGGSNAVLASDGFPVYPGEQFELPAGPALAVWAIGEKAGQAVRVFEAA